MSSSGEKEKKSRFGRLLGKKHDKDEPLAPPPPGPPPSALAEPPASETIPSSHTAVPPPPAGPPPSAPLGPDSTYGSTDPSPDVTTVNKPDLSTNTSHISSLDNRQKLAAIENDDNNLEIRPGQGNAAGKKDVIDRDTGEVVTTVTTTTTTTTTTTRGAGRRQTEAKEQEAAEQARNEEVVRRTHPLTANANRDSDIPSELSANPTPPPETVSAIPFSSSESDPGHSKYGAPDTTTMTHGGYMEGVPENAESPPIPPKSAMRKSMENQRPPPQNYENEYRSENIVSPVSPVNVGAGGGGGGTGPGKHNFSYPARVPPNGNGAGMMSNDQMGGARAEEEEAYHSHTGAPQQSQGTMANLKAAAAGIHGAGETLRGTLSSTLDKHVPLSRNADKQAELLAKHESVTAAGRQEIDSGRFHDSVKEREQEGRTARGLGRIFRKPVAGGASGGGGDATTGTPQDGAPPILRTKSPRRAY